MFREASPDTDGDTVAALMVEYLEWAHGRIREEYGIDDPPGDPDAHMLRRDTCRFMTDAQRMYRSRGFVERAPYPGTEIPDHLQQHWLFFERAALEKPR